MALETTLESTNIKRTCTSSQVAALNIETAMSKIKAITGYRCSKFTGHQHYTGVDARFFYRITAIRQATGFLGIRVLLGERDALARNLYPRNYYGRRRLA